MNLRVVGEPTLDGPPRHYRVVDLDDTTSLAPCEVVLCPCGRTLGHIQPCQ